MIIQQQADSIMEAFNHNKEYALTAVAALIAEHTWVNPISWNMTRKKYWLDVKQCIESIGNKQPTT